MVKPKTWEEFRDTGLLWFINTILHLFGWAIVFDVDENDVTRVMPARVKYRGFDNKTNIHNYIKVSSYLNDNIEELLKEAKE